MTDAEAVRMMREYFEGLFPRTCPKCGKHYGTVRDYILQTQPVGPAISYDVELGDWQPANPLGTFASGNCTCGTTLTLTTAGLPLPKLHAVLHWVKTETEIRGVTPGQLIGWVRDEIRQQVLAGPEPGVGSGNAPKP
jgi:hypothetical protein